MAEVSFEGKQAVFDRLKALAPAVTNKGARFALRKGANLVAAAAIQNAATVNRADTPNDISKNITVRFSNRTFKSTGDIMFRVGVLGGSRQYGDTRENRRKTRVGATYATGGDKTNPGGDTWYWRLLEFGKEGVPARPFMRPALSENAQAVLDTTASQLNAWLDRYFKRQAK